MNRPARIVLGVVVLLALAGGLVWASLPFLVSTDAVRQAIERELGRVAGMPVGIGGPADVRLFPRPVASFSDVSFGTGADGTPLLTAETLEVELRGRSVLGGRPEITAFHLVRPHFRPTTNMDGSIDWERSAGRIGRLLSTLAEGRPVPGPAARLGTIRITNGMVTVGGSADQTADVTALNATLSWPMLDAPLSASGDFIWRGTSQSFRGELRAPVDFVAGRPGPVRIDIKSDTANLAFSGSANAGPSRFADGELTFNTSSMRSVLGLFGSDILPGQALGKVSLSGPVKLSKNRLRFEKLAIDVDGNAGVGVLELEAGPETGTPAVKGTLDFRQLDLAAFLGAFIALPQEGGAPAAVDGNVRSQVQADLRISADSAVFGKLRLSALAATAQVGKDAALFDIGDALGYGGHVQARLQIRGDNGRDKAEVILAGQNVDSLQLARDLPLPKATPAGNGTFSVTLHAPLSDWAAMVATARGVVSLEMRAGSMPGLGMQALERAKAGNRYVSLDTASIGEPFTLATFAAKVGDGVATLERSRITYPRGTIDLTGIVTYETGSLALSAALAGTDPAAAASHFFIGGSWDRPFAIPVLAGVPGID